MTWLWLCDWFRSLVFNWQLSVRHPPLAVKLRRCFLYPLWLWVREEHGDTKVFLVQVPGLRFVWVVQLFSGQEQPDKSWSVSIAWKLNESPVTEKQEGNILVVFYEWGVKPEVERNVLISFRQALNRDIRSWIITQLEELVCNRSVWSYLLRSIQTWPLRLLPPQARSAGWWLQHYCPHQETPKNHPRLGQCACGFEAAVAWSMGSWRDLPSSFPVCCKRTETPAVYSELFSPWGRCRRLYPHLSKKNIRKTCMISPHLQQSLPTIVTFSLSALAQLNLIDPQVPHQNVPAAQSIEIPLMKIAYPYILAYCSPCSFKNQPFVTSQREQHGPPQARHSSLWETLHNCLVSVPFQICKIHNNTSVSTSEEGWMAALQLSREKNKGFTSYGVDADALDLEAFRHRKLSVELGLHNLIVANVPTLRFTGRQPQNGLEKVSKTWPEPQ